MGFLDKAKQAAQDAQAKAKETASDVQAKRDLGKAYTELGEKTYELASSGQLTNAELQPIVDRIRTLKEQTDGAGGGEPVLAGATASTTTATTEPPPSDQPPAMPT